MRACAQCRTQHRHSVCVCVCVYMCGLSFQVYSRKCGECGQTFAPTLAKRGWTPGP